MKMNPAFALLSSLAFAAMPATATLVSIIQSDLPGCDVLLVTSGTFADELGNQFAGFPLGEWITHSSALTELSVCSDVPSNPAITDRLVTITNLQAYTVGGLFYVVNGTGVFSNADGLINGALAMQIDAVGNNRPLISESMTPDNMFEAGETWQFVVQDYQAPPLADFFFTPGLVGSGDARLGNDRRPVSAAPPSLTCGRSIILDSRNGAHRRVCPIFLWSESKGGSKRPRKRTPSGDRCSRTGRVPAGET
jgi:hypothetical protein